MKLLSVLVVACVAIAGALAQTPIPTNPGDNGFAIGNIDAPVVIDGFFDLLCPDCAATWPTVKQVLQAYGTKQLRLNFHTFPLPYHTYAFYANQGLHIVQDYAPTKIWAYADMMFDQQSNFWNPINMDNTTTSIINAMSALVESNKILDAATFKAGLLNDTINEDTRISWKYGTSRGVTGTPTFFANGVMISADPSWSLSDWQSLINSILGINSAEEELKPARNGRHFRAAKSPFTFADTMAANQTCPPKQTPCNYAPKKFECCLAGENCIKNVGCRC